MAILKSIGAFFVKIWHWIKETAWVQPLLIVGAIFAVIFSIPYITEWVGGWTGNGAGAFYEASLLTLEGQTLSGDVTAADRFANVLEANEEKIAEIEACFGDPDFFEKYGNRSAELQRELDAARAEAARLYQRWEELENKRATLEGK